MNNMDYYLEFRKELDKIPQNVDVLKRAIATYGTKAQVDMAIEEMSELTKALCKERRSDLDSSKHTETVANVIEEIADVAIMLRQMMIIFDHDNEVEGIIQYKIDRLAQRLKEREQHGN